jgi:DtxR family transcriptional regulator, Mn-dependent transcriptional regulator
MASASHHEVRRDPADPQTEAIEDYAKAIFGLARRGSGPVGNSALSERLGVSPASVTAMLKRMSELGLVEHQPYRGVTLTESGRKVALEVIRHHRLIESYLAEALGMPWDRVHAEAEVLEHYISEDLEQRIAKALGNPSVDPHGDPIPSAKLALPADEGTVLSELADGDRGVFSRVSDTDPEMLRYLDERGILPGVELLVSDRDPFGGSLLIEVAGRPHSIGERLASRMIVQRR